MTPPPVRGWGTRGDDAGPPSTAAEGGSQGLVLMACLQDLSQARARWGTAADGFLTLFTHNVVLPGIADMATLEAVSALAGDEDVQVTSVTKAHWLSKQWPTTTYSVRRQRRLPVDAVANFPTGRGILLRGTALAWVALPPVRT